MLTVAFATHNGADTLPDMLGAMTLVQPPAGGWRLVAVNNASTDATPDILRSFEGVLPLSVLNEPVPGKSRALNRALRRVEGDLMVLTDDDVLPAEDWLSAWRHYADAHPEFGVFGGRIMLHWSREPPQWLVECIPLGVAYALTHKGPVRGPVDPVFIAGPNMAIRTGALHKGLRFDEAMGPAGDRYSMGEDTAFAYAAERAGFPPAHCPEAVVEHIVQPFQFDPAWLLRRATSYGLCLGRQGATSQAHCDDPVLFGMPRWMIREYVKQRALSTLGWASGSIERYMAAAWEAHYLAGYLRGFREASSNSRPGRTRAPMNGGPSG
jgi:GT2 family glycosyltransferase